MDLKKLLGMIEPHSPKLVYRALQLTNNCARLDEQFTKVYWQLVREGNLLTTFRESYNIYKFLLSTIHLGGDLAELGVYRGGSAKLISSFSSGLDVYLFDTFEGMPEAMVADIDNHKAGDFSGCSLEQCKHYLKDFQNVKFQKGLFPASTEELSKDLQFCFVNLDSDLYQSTLSGLEFFYPRMKQGGIIMSHDYNSISCPGVRKAFDTFLADKKEHCIPIWDTQCLIKIA